MQMENFDNVTSACHTNKNSNQTTRQVAYKSYLSCVVYRATDIAMEAYNNSR